MNDGLTESEKALNCIIENYINELQRNTCDDNEEDLIIYKEKMDYIESQKEIVLKDLEMIELLKKCYYCASFSNTLFKTSYGFDNPQDIKKIEVWLDA